MTDSLVQGSCVMLMMTIKRMEYCCVDFSTTNLTYYISVRDLTFDLRLAFKRFKSILFYFILKS